MVKKFLKTEAQRVFYLLVAVGLSIVFFSLGLESEGKTFLVAVATLALNRARGTDK